MCLNVEALACRVREKDEQCKQQESKVVFSAKVRDETAPSRLGFCGLCVGYNMESNGHQDRGDLSTISIFSHGKSETCFASTDVDFG